MKIRLSMWAGNRTRQLPMFPVPMIYITGCEANCSRILVGTIGKGPNLYHCIHLRCSSNRTLTISSNLWPERKRAKSRQGSLGLCSSKTRSVCFSAGSSLRRKCWFFVSLHVSQGVKNALRAWATRRRKIGGVPSSSPRVDGGLGS